MFNNFTNKQYSILFQVLILVVSWTSILPVLVYAKYNVPGPSDDFFHGFYMLDKSYWEGVFYWYKTGYNGRFANAIFMQLPGRPFLNPKFGRIYPIVNFILFFIAQSYLIRVLTKRQSLLSSLAISSVFFTIIVGYTPRITQFYWFSGMTVYIIPALFYFVLLGTLIKHFNKRQNVFSIIVSIIAPFFVIGSNENWMLMMLFTVFVFVIFSKEKLKNFKPSTWVFVGYIIFLVLLMVLAPGTINRLDGEQSSFENQDLIASLSNSIFHISKFINGWYLSSCLLFVSIVIGMLYPNSKWSGNSIVTFPVWLSSISVLFVIYIGTFIMLYSLGFSNWIRLRGLIPVYFVGAILIVYTGVAIGNSSLFQSLHEKIGLWGSRFTLLILLLISISGSNNYKVIVNEINNGKAQKLAEQNLFIIDYIESNPSDTVYVPNVSVKSKVLLPISISTTPKGLTHWFTSTYFKKKLLMDNKSQTIEQLMDKELKKEKAVK